MTATGWECPRCHRCYAPHVDECRACSPIPKQIPPVTSEVQENYTRAHEAIAQEFNRFDWSKP